MFKIIFFLLGIVAMAYSVPAPAPKPAAKPDLVVPVIPDPDLPNPVRLYDQPHQLPVQFYNPPTYAVYRSYDPLFYNQYYY